MAPRGRQRKRSSRMHGAIDNMAPLGFAALLVQKTVRQLLKVYGGDEGWTFLEADGYKELIDAIPCNQETNDEDTKKIEKEGVSSQYERAECNIAVNTVGEASCSMPATAAGESGSSSHVFAPPPTSSPCLVNYPKMCSGSQVQSGSNPHVSIPPPTSPHVLLIIYSSLLIVTLQTFLPQSELSFSHRAGAFPVMGGLEAMEKRMLTSFNYHQCDQRLLGRVSNK